MADIVLVQPISNRYDRVTTRIPNGLLAISALPEKADFSIKIVDCRTDNYWQQTLRHSIDHNTLCVGITCSTGNMILNALKAAHAVRAINPQLPIVWGGPHPTLLPEQTLESSLVDIIVINEGDKVFLELVNALAEKRVLSEIKGIGYKENGKIRINPPAEFIKELDALPSFPYHLVDMSRYSSLDVEGLPSIDILTSRGCPYNCGFCSSPVTSKRIWRPLSVERIIETIVFLKEKYGIKTFYFVDDNFMVDINRVERLLDALKENHLEIYWGTQGVCVETINRMPSRLLDKIEESGCVELSIGVESANPEILDMIDKKNNPMDVFLMNSKLARRKFSVKYNMIIGFPGEKISEVKKTVNLALALYKKNKHAWFPFNIFTPFPETKMFQKSIECGFNPPTLLEGWAKLESTGWGRYFNHWMSRRQNRLLESINCTSYAAFPAAFQRISNKIIKTVFQFYQPFAYLRFKHMFYFMHFEKIFLQITD